MGWAKYHIERLQKGEEVSFRPRGNSMLPLIRSGQLCHVLPIWWNRPDGPDVGDIVLCRAGGREYLHLVTAVNGERYQISNNKGHINGWISIHNIYGYLAYTED